MKVSYSEILAKNAGPESYADRGNTAIRLGRKVTWDPAAEQLNDDDSANAMLSRKQREGYEILA